MKHFYIIANLMLISFYMQNCVAMHVVEVGGFDIASPDTAAKSVDAGASARSSDASSMPAVGAIAKSSTDAATKAPTLQAQSTTAGKTKTVSDTGTASGATLDLAGSDIIYTDNPMFTSQKATVKKRNIAVSADTISAASSETMDAPASIAIFSDITRPDATLPFEAQIQSVVDQLDDKLTNVRGIDAGISGLKILGVDPAKIAAMPDPGIAKQLRTEIAQKAHALQISLGNAMDYSDIATAAGLKKINDTYNTGSWSQIPPADLATINNLLAKLSLPQITAADFSNTTLAQKVANGFLNLVSGGSSGTAATENFKTLTRQANSIITLALDKADAYLANVVAGKISK